MEPLMPKKNLYVVTLKLSDFFKLLMKMESLFSNDIG